nr:zinc finger (C3HC4 type RING finger) protein [Hymenolepis microstoma]
MVDNECPVCREVIQAEVGTPDSCRHSHCYACLWTWVLRKRNCPYCRAEISKIIVSNGINRQLIRFEPQPLHLIVRVSRDDPDKITIYPIYGENETLTYSYENESHLTKVVFESLLWRFIAIFLKSFLKRLETLNGLFVKRILSPNSGPTLDENIIDLVQTVFIHLQHSPQDLSQLIIYGVEENIANPEVGMIKYMQSVDNYFFKLQIKALRMRRDLLEWFRGKFHDEEYARLQEEFAVDRHYIS